MGDFTTALPCVPWLEQPYKNQNPTAWADPVKITCLLKTDVFGAGISAAITLCSLPAIHKHPWFLAQLCFPPSWQKPWLWSVGIKLGICCSQFLFCCWNSHLCEITTEKCFYLWCFIYFLFLWHVLQKCKNPPLFSCVYPAGSQETVWLCTCLRWRREGSVGSQCLPSVKTRGSSGFPCVALQIPV